MHEEQDLAFLPALDVLSGARRISRAPSAWPIALP
jgi:hypothetical protein